MKSLKESMDMTDTLDFLEIKYTRDFYYPDSKRIVKLYNYCILNTDTLLDVDHVSFHIEMKR